MRPIKRSSSFTFSWYLGDGHRLGQMVFDGMLCGMNEKQTNHWSRQEIAEKLAELEAQVRLKPETSQRQLAEELGIPRTTLQHWIKRKEEIDALPEIRDFFCSPTGLAFLHRLVLGAHFTLVMLSGGSPRKVAQFLELTGLDRFVGLY